MKKYKPFSTNFMTNVSSVTTNVVSSVDPDFYMDFLTSYDDDVRIKKVIEKYSYVPRFLEVFPNKDYFCEIIDNLYIGTMETDYTSFDVVIKVYDSEQDQDKIDDFRRRGGIFFNYNISEDDIQTYIENIDEIVDKLHHYLAHDYKVLVHCYAGMNRSVTVIGEYVIRSGYYNACSYFCQLTKLKWKYRVMDAYVNRLIKLKKD